MGQIARRIRSAIATKKSFRFFINYNPIARNAIIKYNVWQYFEHSVFTGGFRPRKITIPERYRYPRWYTRGKITRGLTHPVTRIQNQTIPTWAAVCELYKKKKKKVTIPIVKTRRVRWQIAPRRTRMRVQNGKGRDGNGFGEKYR